MLTVSQKDIARALAALSSFPELTATPAVTATYTRYVAALGPSLRQLGLVPTLAVYAAGGEGKQKKDKLLPLLRELVLPAFPDIGGNTLFGYAAGLADRQKDGKLRLLRKQLEAAATALKLAFRTHPQRSPENIDA